MLVPSPTGLSDSEWWTEPCLSGSWSQTLWVHHKSLQTQQWVLIANGSYYQSVSLSLFSLCTCIFVSVCLPFCLSGFIHCLFILLLLGSHMINTLRALMLFTTVWLFGLITFITVENATRYNVHTYFWGASSQIFVSVLVLDHNFIIIIFWKAWPRQNEFHFRSQQQYLVPTKINYHVDFFKVLFCHIKVWKA